MTCYAVDVGKFLLNDIRIDVIRVFDAIRFVHIYQPKIDWIILIDEPLQEII